VAHLAERRGRRPTGETGANDDHRVLATVRRIDQLQLEATRVPRVFDRSVGNVARRQRIANRPSQIGLTHGRAPNMIAHGIARKPRHTTTEITPASACSRPVNLWLLRPNVWNIDQMPWKRCKHSAPIANV